MKNSLIFAKTMSLLLFILLLTGKSINAQVCAGAVDLKECIKRMDVLITKQQTLLDSITTLNLSSPAMPVKVNPIPFKSSLHVFTTPVEFRNTAANDAASFLNPTIINQNSWDWGAESDTWTEITPPHGAKNIYAKITLSIISPTHHSPCIWLRRQYFVSTDVWTNDGDPIYLGCINLGLRAPSPGSAVITVPWWNKTMPIYAWGAHPTQRLQISAHSNWPGDAQGAVPWSLSGMQIELYEGL